MKATVILQYGLFITCVSCSMTVLAEDSKILATGGVTQVEGSAGGGIVPWAVISTYAQQDEWGATLFDSYVTSDDFNLNVVGFSVAYSNLLELSVAKQHFDLGPLQDNLGLPSNQLEQKIYGAKVRLFGDFIYQAMPQISLGVQYKRVEDFTIPSLVGADDKQGIDVYMSASKLWLDTFSGYPLIANVTLRSTRANQMGLLGFGGDLNSKRELLWEINTSLLLSRDLVVGYEFRQKPNNLGFAKEQDWQDVYLAWFYDKSLSGVIAWTDLGSIAGLDGQQGVYLSLQVTF